jgi:transketolase
LRTAFIETLIQLAKKDDTVFLITPDMGYSVLEKFRDEFPNQFLNSGIAEQNTISVAAGLASSGYTVFVYSIIPFVTMRCFEQVRLDLAYNNTNVKLVGIGAGLTYGSLGASHHAIEDIAIMRSIPNMTVLCPGDPIETRELVKRSYEKNGPVYIRLGKNGEANIHDANTRIEIGKSIEITQGTDFALITTSNTLELGKQWTDEWKNENLSVSLISMPSIKPFDNSKINELLSKQIPILTLEEHNVIGGLGSAVAEIIATSEKSVPFKRIGINDVFSHDVGSHNYQRKMINFNEKPSVDFLKK